MASYSNGDVGDNKSVDWVGAEDGDDSGDGIEEEEDALGGVPLPQLLLTAVLVGPVPEVTPPTAHAHRTGVERRGVGRAALSALLRQHTAEVLARSADGDAGQECGMFGVTAELPPGMDADVAAVCQAEAALQMRGPGLLGSFDVWQAPAA